MKLFKSFCLFLCLIGLFFLFGCNNKTPNEEDNKEKEEPVLCEHVWDKGKCSICGVECDHEFSSGKCVICGIKFHDICKHVFKDGTCVNCNYHCPHEEFVDGICKVCGIELQAICEHQFEDGFCVICGKACEHSYFNGECQICNHKCTHEHVTDLICDECGINIQSVCHHKYVLGVCSKCGYKCTHERIYEGMCLICGSDMQLVCDHKFKNGVCTVCGYECEHIGVKCNDRCEYCQTIVGHKYYEGKCYMCGEDGFVTNKIPDKFTQDCLLKGTVEKTVFMSYDYANSRPYENTFFVYLPYGYYDNNREYNVLYLLHGSGENSAYWLAQLGYAGGYTELTKKVLDNLFFYGIVKDTIVVTPTQRLNGNDNFYKELIGNIMPLAETKYRTKAHLYGKQVSEVSRTYFMESRDYRAMAGLSQGAIITWRIMGNLFQYFSYFGAYSGGAYDGLSKCKETLRDPKNAEYKVNYCYNSCGDQDSMYAKHLSDYYEIVNASDKMTDGENAIFLTKKGFAHRYESWIIDLYNSLGFAFFKEKPRNQ